MGQCCSKPNKKRNKGKNRRLGSVGAEDAVRLKSQFENASSRIPDKDQSSENQEVRQDNDHPEDVIFWISFGCIGLGYAWDVIPEDTKVKLLTLVPSIHVCADLANVVGGSFIGAALVTIQVSLQAWDAIKRWWGRRISGMECIIEIVRISATTVVGLLGARAGVIIGGFAGPFGCLVGGFFGGIISSSVTDRLLQQIFNLPREEALQRAYNNPEVRSNAPDHETNKAFHKHKLCLNTPLNRGVLKMSF